eukprot:8681418-Prorocentrum_lima.AAC.1
MAFGDDDCGEDLSSIARVADITYPFDFGAPVFLLREHTLERVNQDPEHEAFLVRSRTQPAWL